MRSPISGTGADVEDTRGIVDGGEVELAVELEISDLVGNLETVLLLFVVGHGPAPWVEGVVGAIVFGAEGGKGVVDGDVDRGCGGEVVAEGVEGVGGGGGFEVGVGVVGMVAGFEAAGGGGGLEILGLVRGKYNGEEEDFLLGRP